MAWWLETIIVSGNILSHMPHRTVCYNFPLVRDKPLGAPAFVKLVYWHTGRLCSIFTAFLQGSENKCHSNLMRNTGIFLRETVSENVVCKTIAVLLIPSFVKAVIGTDNIKCYIHYVCDMPHASRSCMKCFYTVNSSPPGAAYMRRWTGSALVQIMACRLLGAMPLPEPTLTCRQLEQTSVKLESKCKTFDSWKCTWICRLRNGSHFVQGEMS